MSRASMGSSQCRLSQRVRPCPRKSGQKMRKCGASRGVMIGFAVVIVLLLAAFLVEYTADRRERSYARAARSRRRR